MKKTTGTWREAAICRSCDHVNSPGEADWTLVSKHLHGNNPCPRCGEREWAFNVVVRPVFATSTRWLFFKTTTRTGWEVKS